MEKFCANYFIKSAAILNIGGVYNRGTAKTESDRSFTKVAKYGQFR